MPGACPKGYSIVRQASSTQHGFDIVARRNGADLIIEAKGAGSSKPDTARYGKEFNANQVHDHVAKAVLKALRVVSAGNAQAGIALPDNSRHRREIEQVARALRHVDITVFWIDEQGAVRIDPGGGL
jgi:hypothetical protein